MRCNNNLAYGQYFVAIFGPACFVWKYQHEGNTESGEKYQDSQMWETADESHAILNKIHQSVCWWLVNTMINIPYAFKQNWREKPRRDIPGVVVIIDYTNWQ